jgi:predicted lipoprotein
MLRSASRLRRALLVAAAASPLSACETPFTTIAPEVTTSARRVGPAHGEASMWLFAGTPTYNVLPIGWQGRAQRAYDEALASCPGADALAGITFQEHWFWFVVGTRRKLVLDGEGVVR